jgi:hypothetical protein
MVNRTIVKQLITPPCMRGRVQGGKIVSHAVAGTAGGMPGGLTLFVWLLQSPIHELVKFPIPQRRCA